eukprot:TRINITY_DN64619_c0_g1_i1.p1 TRINITY_DN64619_c0_g1~~TRINITY_DN64619_c0_g1_i1.p1  ORF type:complete len:727 (+),score=126.46 TRINITY_DN64619_c0_g1_i1:72-2183(+)
MATVDVFNAPEFEVLSNFAPGFGFYAEVDIFPHEKRWWPTAEHFFQAGKFAIPALQEQIRRAEEAGIAKRLGRTLNPLRSDWDDIKRGRIRQAMLQKFWAHKAPREVLLGIQDGVGICNANPVDPYFGVGSDGNGANVIGLVLEELRAFFRKFPQRRRLPLKVSEVGHPFEPFSVLVDVTGCSPEAVCCEVARVLKLPRGVVQRVDFLHDGGFERTSLEDFDSDSAVEAFLAANADDCEIEVHLESVAAVTLWDATGDYHLGRTDLCHVCSSVEALTQRMHALMPILRHAAFRHGCLTFTVDDGDAVELNEASFPMALSAASEGADVLISGKYTIPTESQQSLMERPCADGLGSSRIRDDLGDPQLLSDRVRGLIWGAALGDAVGLATEFMKKEEAAKLYPDPAKLGPATRVDDRHRSRWTRGDWTDDTDQLVLVMEAVVAGQGVLDQRLLATSLKSWTQNGFPELGDKNGLGIGETVKSVMDHPAFDMAPDVAAETVWRQSACTAAANGAVMRCATAALGYFWDTEVLSFNAAASAAVTHPDPRCVASCVAVAHLIANTLLGPGPEALTSEIRDMHVASAFLAARSFLDGGDADELERFMSVKVDGLETLKLGQGGIGYTYKPLGAACWAFMHAENFTDAVTSVVMEAGDADTNAVVVGAVLGARLGYSHLPAPWLDQLPGPQREWMETKVTACLRMLGLDN